MLQECRSLVEAFSKIHRFEIFCQQLVLSKSNDDLIGAAVYEYQNKQFIKLGHFSLQNHIFRESIPQENLLTQHNVRSFSHDGYSTSESATFLSLTMFTENMSAVVYPILKQNTHPKFLLAGVFISKRELSVFLHEWFLFAKACLEVFLGETSTSMEGPKLTIRQSKILELVLLGKTNKEISMILNTSEATVKGEISQLFKSHSVTNRAELSRQYNQQGFLHSQNGKSTQLAVNS